MGHGCACGQFSLPQVLASLTFGVFRMHMRTHVCMEGIVPHSWFGLGRYHTSWWEGPDLYIQMEFVPVTRPHACTPPARPRKQTDSRVGHGGRHWPLILLLFARRAASKPRSARPCPPMRRCLCTCSAASRPASPERGGHSSLVVPSSRHGRPEPRRHCAPRAASVVEWVE